MFLSCCFLDEASAPVMEAAPENRTVRDGRDETFQCKAGGAPTPNTTWIFNGWDCFLCFFFSFFLHGTFQNV